MFYLRIKGELTFKEIGDILGKSEEWSTSYCSFVFAISFSLIFSSCIISRMSLHLSQFDICLSTQKITKMEINR